MVMNPVREHPDTPSDSSPRRGHDHDRSECTLRSRLDLSRRVERVDAFTDGEREWISASTSRRDGSPTGAEPDVDPDRITPLDPPTTVHEVSDADAERLAEAGIVSVRQLSRIPAASVAAAIDVDVKAVRTWRFAARRRLA
jgi:hypothetical protein